jgi:hypothetical protein
MKGYSTTCFTLLFTSFNQGTLRNNHETAHPIRVDAKPSLQIERADTPPVSAGRIRCFRLEDDLHLGGR